MFFLVLEIKNFRQLHIINPPLIDEIQKFIDDILLQKKISLYERKSGRFIFSFSSEIENKIRKKLQIAFSLFDYMLQRKNELFGFNLLFIRQNKNNATPITVQAHDMLFKINQEDGFWIHKKDEQFLTNTVQTEKYDDFFRIVKLIQVITPNREFKHVKMIRIKIIKNFLKLINNYIIKKSKRIPIIVYGPVHCGKTTIIKIILKRIFKQKYFGFIPIISPLFKNEPVYFTFLQFFRNKNYKIVADYLNPTELSIWQKLKKLLLDNKCITSYQYQDYYLLFNLYLNAFIRMMNKNSLPSIIVIKDLEIFHPTTRNLLLIAIKDFLHKKALIPIIISNKQTRIKQIKKSKTRDIYIPPVSLKEIMRCYKKLYPGLQIPIKVIKKIRELANGKINRILHYLYYLMEIKKIVKEDDQYSWISHERKKILLPVNHLAVTWSFIKQFNRDIKIILYTIHISSKLLSTSQLIQFLKQFDLDDEFIKEQITFFFEVGLTTNSVNIKPLFNHLKKIFKNHMPEICNKIEQSLFNFLLFHMQNENIYLLKQVLLLFRLNTEKNEAISLLKNAIEQKLSFGLLEEINSLLQIPKLKKFISANNKENMELLLQNTQIRAFLSKQEYGKVHDIISSINIESQKSNLNFEEVNFLLQKARLDLCLGQNDESLNQLKKTLIHFQNTGSQNKIVETYLEIGQAMLAKANLKDALEYFSIAGSLADENKKQLYKIKSLAFKAITLFIQGNLSASQKEINNGNILSDSIGQRMWHIFFLFFRARIFFELGLYEKNIKTLEQAIVICTIYGKKIQRNIITAWLARTHIYLQNFTLALGILKKMSPTAEILFFIGETYFFSGRLKNALNVFNKALAVKDSNKYLTVEAITWIDGFSAIEERCREIIKKESLIKRFVRNYRAYLNCLINNKEQGFFEMQKLAATNKSLIIDPYSHFFHYFHSMLLQKQHAEDSEDFLTILNKALMELQKKSAQIDSSIERNNFLENNYWNKKIMYEAKKNKLLL